MLGDTRTDIVSSAAQVEMSPKEDEFAMTFDSAFGDYAMSLLVFDIITNLFAPLRNAVAFFAQLGPESGSPICKGRAVQKHRRDSKKPHKIWPQKGEALEKPNQRQPVASSAGIMQC